MEIRTLHDIYRCPHCAALAAHGNSFCRGCGIRFADKDVETMKKDVRSAVWASPWNTRDRFHCVKCSEFVAISDRYCRRCGTEFDKEKVKKMKAKIRELASRNMPSVIGLVIFVLVVILASIGNVKS